jgi:hypothetical protein
MREGNEWDTRDSTFMAWKDEACVDGTIDEQET